MINAIAVSMPSYCLSFLLLFSVVVLSGHNIMYRSVIGELMVRSLFELKRIADSGKDYITFVASSVYKILFP